MHVFLPWVTAMRPFEVARGARLLVVLLAAVLSSCHGASRGGVLPPVGGFRQPQAATASVTQWTSNSAFAPASVKISWPAAPAVGDVLIVALWNNGQSTGASNTYTPPAGWALVDQNTSHAYATYQTFSHVVAAGETNSYVFTPQAAQRQHVWIAADVGNATAVDRSGNTFISNSTSFTTPSVTPSQAGDLAIAFNLPMTNNSVTWANPPAWTLGTQSLTWHGEALSETLSSTAATSESSTLSAAATGFSAIVLLSPSGTPTGSPTPAPPPTPTPPPGSTATPAQWASNAVYAPSALTVSFPSAPAAGDTLLVALWNNGQSDGSANTYTPPTGWALVDQNTAQSYATYQTFSHVVSTGETNAYVFKPLASVREHAWIGSDIKSAGTIENGDNLFVNNNTAYTTPTVVPQHNSDLAIVFDLPMTANNVTWTNPAGWTLGTGPSPTWHGQAVYQALSTTSAISESSKLSAAATGFSAIVLVAPSSTQSTPPPNVPYTDWSTFGDNLQRTNYNPNESTLGPSNVASLKLSWSANLGAAVTDQPVIATNVSIGGTPTTVAYIGTEAGKFYALNADTGAVIWSASLGTITSACADLPGGTFGITGTATYDKSTNRVYVADGKDQVHALGMATGTEATGWPVTVTNQFSSNHIYGALTFNPNNGMLYVTTGSLCDSGSWQGRVAEINAGTASIVNTFFPASPYFGAGVWGIGGVAIDPSSPYDVYIATGNTQTANSANNAPTEFSGYGDQVVHLTSSLGVVAANYPGLTGSDVDFGATPMLFSPGSCAQELSAKNKSGVFVTYFTASLGSGPIENLNMAPTTFSGIFIGTTAYSPAANLVYVGDPQGNATYTHGLIALSVQPDCTLGATPAWVQTEGPAATDGDNYSATVANGVVYFTDGLGNEAFAFNAATGQLLWNSGTTIKGTTNVAPTVDGRVFVSSWDGHLYAFGL